MTSRLIRWFGGRPTATESTLGIWAMCLLDTVLFFGVIMVAFPWIADWLFPQKLPFPRLIRTWGGSALFALGMVGWAACIEAFARSGRGTPSPLAAPSLLMTKGLFAIVRNPLIVAELIVLWGEALYVASLGIVLYAIGVSLAGHLIVVYIEEPTLRERFGDEYQAYCQKVPRWRPLAGPKRV